MYLKGQLREAPHPLTTPRSVRLVIALCALRDKRGRGWGSFLKGANKGVEVRDDHLHTGVVVLLDHARRQPVEQATPADGRLPPRSSYAPHR